MPSASLSSGRSPKRCHQGSSEGCLEAHVASKIGIARRRMHDNVCKAVVEHAVWRDPDAGAGEVVVERGRELLANCIDRGKDQLLL